MSKFTRMPLSEAKRVLRKSGYKLIKEAAQDDWGYGDGGTIFTPTGADGQYATDRFPMCKAIKDNDVKKLEHYSVYGFGYKENDDPWGEDITSFDEEYDKEFKEDYALVFKGKNIDDALKYMLDYDSEFFVAPFDLINLFHAGEAGCSAETLKKLVDNYLYVSDTELSDEADGTHTWQEIFDAIQAAIPVSEV